jgi:hypothetical protein
MIRFYVNLCVQILQKVDSMVAAQLVFHHHPPSLIDDLEARARKLGKDLSTIDLDAITLPVGVDFDIAR